MLSLMRATKRLHNHKHITQSCKTDSEWFITQTKRDPYTWKKFTSFLRLFYASTSNGNQTSSFRPATPTSLFKMFSYCATVNDSYGQGYGSIAENVLGNTWNINNIIRHTISRLSTFTTPSSRFTHIHLDFLEPLTHSSDYRFNQFMSPDCFTASFTTIVQSSAQKTSVVIVWPDLGKV